jgi:photosystem II stability/assembly factor-like uncharacterized protein
MKSLLCVLFILLLSFNTVLSQDDGVGVWTQTLSTTNRIYCSAINPVNQNIMYIGTLDGGVYKTTNGGINWNQINNGMSYYHVQCIAVSTSNPDILFAGTDSLGGWSTSGIYKSTDAGANWTLVSQDIYDTKGIQAILIHPSNPNIVYSGVFNAVAASVVGLWKSTNGGINWFASSTGMDNKQILSIVINPLNPNVLYVGSSLTFPGSTGPVKIYKSYDAGANWISIVNGIPQTSTDNNPVRCMSISTLDTSLLLAGLFMNATALSGGMYVTTNGGQLWTKKQNGLYDTVYVLPRSCLIKPGSTTEYYVGLDNNSVTTKKGVFKTTDGGNNWVNFNGGSMVNTYAIRTLAFKTSGNPTLFAGDGGTATASTGTGLYEFSWYPVSTGNSNSSVPTTFDLSQNYPNPFNPITKIQYQIPVSGFVKISVFDLLGRELKVLVEENQNAGYYSLEFDGSEFTSGVYFYRLYTDRFTDTKKMILIK